MKEQVNICFICNETIAAFMPLVLTDNKKPVCQSCILKLHDSLIYKYAKLSDALSERVGE